MKKLLTILLCAVLAINCSALSVVNSKYDYTNDNTNITIEFASDSALSAEKQQQIADYMVYGDDGASTYAWCWLTGHDYVYETVLAIEHKVSDLSPRCMRRSYSVETCTKCDHIEETLISQTLIACCPEE
ncbi:MAG: hypothetical protein IJ325_13345 [Clostridia bacterium]|nr:hypothetical protein [Clostridia bacterium]